MGKRRKARELAMQVQFHLEFSPGDPNEVFDLVCDRFNPRKSIRSFSRKLVLGVCEKKAQIDETISKVSKHWRLERMPFVDKCILRLAVYEMLFLEDIPAKVSIDEAVELGKTYGSQDSASFINGILDSIYAQFVRET